MIKRLFKKITWLVVILFLILNILAAFHAYKFTHFYKDVERTDPTHLSLLQKANMILFGINYPKSEVKQKPNLGYKEIQLTTMDGITISAWLIENNSSKNAIVLFHGHGSSKSSLIEEAEYFHSIGFSTLLLDFRSHGESEGEACTIGYKEAEEVNLAVSYLKQNEFDKISLYGSSMGAAAILKAMVTYNLEVDRLILEMPFGSLLDAVKGRVRLMSLPESPIAHLLTFWGGVEQGFWAFGYNPCSYSTQIKVPVLLQWGSMDIRVRQFETNCIYESISTKKKLVVYEGAGHQSLMDFDNIKWKREVKSFLIGDN